MLRWMVSLDGVVSSKTALMVSWFMVDELLAPNESPTINSEFGLIGFSVRVNSEFGRSCFIHDRP